MHSILTNKHILLPSKADTLKLDKYVMIDQIQGTQSKPVILFAFGEVSKAGEEIIDYISYFHFWHEPAMW